MKSRNTINTIRNKLLSLLNNTEKHKHRRLAELEGFSMSGKRLADSGCGIIVSLTSFGSRLESVHLSILSVMDQTVPPDFVVLYLDSETSASELPHSLRELEERGLKIIRGVENIRGHKKYLYAMQNYPDRIIFTIDDDLIYPKDSIESVLESSKRYPGCVVARRVHRVNLTNDGMMDRYTRWVYEYKGPKQKSNDFFLTSGGGTLFPPHSIERKALSIKDIRENALSADDVWLTCALRASGIDIVRARTKMPLFWVLDANQEDALCRENILKGGNDIAMEKSMRFFGLSPKDFTD